MEQTKEALTGLLFIDPYYASSLPSQQPIYKGLKDCIAFFSCAPSVPRAVTLVIHGLNVKPTAMQALIGWLNAQGSPVYLVQLCGHGRGDVKSVTVGLWQQEVEDGYAAAQQASVQLGVPLFFLGYSLGALLAQTFLSLPASQPAFHKQVLFSPAIGLRQRSYWLRHLFFLGGRFMLPSFTPRAYKANARLPLHLYQILYAEEQKLLQSPWAPLNIPTLVFMDPKDELISYKRLQTFLQQQQLTQWQLVPLLTSFTGRQERFHHLILNAATMGEKNWRTVTTAMQTFLFDS